MIWVKMYVFSTFNKKEDVSRLKLFSEQFFFITAKLVAVDLLIPILQCTNAHLSNIFRFWIKKILLACLVQKSFWHSMWRILQYNLLFSSNSDHNLQKQPKTAKHLILYTLCNMKMHYKHFWPKYYGYDAFSLNLRIFNIYLLCIKQN